jgi:hypothetical protein
MHLVPITELGPQTTINTTKGRKMNFALLCLISIISSVIFGLAFLLAPESIASVYGIGNWNPGTTTIARLFGIELLYSAGIYFAMKETKDPVIQQRCGWTLAIVSAVALLVAVQSIFSGATNVFMWSVAAIYAFFTVAWGRIALRQAA